MLVEKCMDGLVPPVPGVAHGGMVYCHYPCPCAVAQPVTSRGDVLSVYHDVLLFPPSPVTGQKTPKPLAPDDDIFGQVLVQHLIESPLRLKILFLRTRLSCLVHCHLQEVEEQERLPYALPFIPVRLVSHEAPLKLQVGAHPAFPLRIGIEIRLDYVSGEGGAVARLARHSAVGTLLPAVMALTKNHHPLAEDAARGIVMPHEGEEEYIRHRHIIIYVG